MSRISDFIVASYPIVKIAANLAVWGVLWFFLIAILRDYKKYFGKNTPQIEKFFYFSLGGGVIFSIFLLWQSSTGDVIWTGIASLLGMMWVVSVEHFVALMFPKIKLTRKNPEEIKKSLRTLSFLATFLVGIWTVGTYFAFKRGLGWSLLFIVWVAILLITSALCSIFLASITNPHHKEKNI